MLKALADRLAEAFAERLHQRASRTDLWGYAPGRCRCRSPTWWPSAIAASVPTPGYPACPDHGVKRDLFRTLGCADIGMSLTENLAMLPAASVS